MVKEHHLWLPSAPRLAYFINKFQDCHIQGRWRPLPAVSFALCHAPVPEVSVLSKILPLPQHRVFDCINILSRDPIDPVVRRFCWAQLKCLQSQKRQHLPWGRRAADASRQTQLLHQNQTSLRDQAPPPTTRGSPGALQKPSQRTES